MSTVGSGLIQAAVGATISHQLQTVESTDNIEDSSFDTGLLSTVVRRLILFLLKFTTAVLEREAQCKKVIIVALIIQICVARHTQIYRKH